MADMLFDTQKMVERLESAGVPAAQARMHIAVLAEVISTLEAVITERCASKKDLEKQKSDLVRWVVSVGILQTTLICALILKLLP